MSAITDELIETNLPDKTSGKYKPKRLRTLLKDLTSQILTEASSKKAHRMNQALGIGPDFSPAKISMIAGGDVKLKKVLLVLQDSTVASIPVEEQIKISCNGQELYAGPVTPTISIHCDEPIFSELDIVTVLIEHSCVAEYLFYGTVITEEL